jgi:hypothetical protein
MNPGFWAITLSTKIATDLRVKGSDTDKKTIYVKAAIIFKRLWKETGCRSWKARLRIMFLRSRQTLETIKKTSNQGNRTLADESHVTALLLSLRAIIQE